MCQHGTDKGLMPVVVNCRNQPVLVPADIEHRQAVHVISTGERCPQFIKIGKDLTFHSSKPRLQWAFGIRVLFPKFNKGRLGYNVHEQIIYRNGMLSIL